MIALDYTFRKMVERCLGIKAVKISTYTSGKGIGNTVLSIVSHLSTEESARSGIRKNQPGLVGFFILSLPLTPAEFSHEFLPTWAFVSSCPAAPHAPQALCSHIGKWPQRPSTETALLLNLRSFCALPFCSGSGYKLLPTNGREKGRDAHMGEWAMDLPKGQCLWHEGKQLQCSSRRCKYLCTLSGCFSHQLL